MEFGGSSRVVVENLGFLSSFDGDLGFPFELQQESGASSQVAAGNLGFP